MRFVCIELVRNSYMFKLNATTTETGKKSRKYCQLLDTREVRRQLYGFGKDYTRIESAICDASA